MENIKELLQQYRDLLQEKKDKQAAVARVEKRLKEMESRGYKEVDSVSGGNGGKQHFKIEGFPYPEYHRQRTLLLLRQKRLKLVQSKIDIQLVSVEKFIDEIEDSRMRRLLTYRYVEGMSWQQIANKMGGGNTEDGCRIEVSRFLKRH